MCLFHTEQAPLALSDEDAYQAYRDQLVAAGYLVPLSVRGLYARAGAFERIVEAFDAYVTRQSAHLKAEVLRFPPIFARANYERIDHIRNFPDLMGSVHVFKGGDREHQRMLESFERRGNWSAALAPGEAMLIPAACYSLYPTATGTLPEGGRQIDLESFVFRHEPSDDPARMQVFRQREFVRLG
ncbi:MAG TPA: amino acid--[acyl-carrier-protein] ligase, partial [Usitatibacter sp.]|nr:amino acid--[acyl-carrier-protein] ligase [Usitatibacter sp.]